MPARREDLLRFRQWGGAERFWGASDVISGAMRWVGLCLIVTARGEYRLRRLRGAASHWVVTGPGLMSGIGRYYGGGSVAKATRVLDRLRLMSSRSLSRAASGTSSTMSVYSNLSKTA